MKCDESLVLLSELQAGALDETTTSLVREHLANCHPCDGVFQDIDTLVLTARTLRAEGEGISFPDEELVWQRLGVAKRTIH